MEEGPQCLDLRGLKCPLPALMARRALRCMSPGGSLTAIADDPLAHIDVPYMCAQEGFELVSLVRDGDVARMVLRRPD
jgi:tRNA 2-thiouridine synthesizing protein A